MANNSVFTISTSYPCSAEELYRWHSRDGALERLLPPWENAEIIHKSGGIDAGAKVELVMRQGPFGLVPVRFKALHTKAEPFSYFQDIQEKGPFSSWQHDHFFNDNESDCELLDKATYALPAGHLLPGGIKNFVTKNLERMFRHRKERLLADIRLHKKYSKKPLRILISGASGVVGKELVSLLTTGGHEVWRLVRRKPLAPFEVFWNPEQAEIDLSTLPKLDGVIHLAGEYITLAKWSEEKKKRVLESRIKGTRCLVKAITELSNPPSVFLSASANGYYGGASGLPAEDTPAGTSFIAQVCKVWEEEAVVAEKSGIKTVLMRLGVGITPKGGALQRILRASPFGFIRRFGSGKQIMSWISMDDLTAAVLHCLVTPDLHGPVNIAVPTAVTNEEFNRILAKITGRPLLFPIPAWLLKLLYKELADEMLLAECGMKCEKLVKSGFQFNHPDLETALRSMLGRWKNYS